MQPHLRTSLLRPPRRPVFTSRTWTNSRGGRTVPRVKAHWNAERLQADKRYPLSVELNKRPQSPFDPLYSKRGYNFVRTQIVSPGLCDDVLKYIGPSLEKHRGCDILDLNPGAAVWSQKLHEYLQPRSHVLLESNPEQWAEYLDPLLKKPGSTYKLCKGDICSYDTYKKMREAGMFPHQKEVDRKDPASHQPNNSLLVTGSLMWDPKLPGKGFDSMAKQVILGFAQHAWSKDSFHAFGPVRSLLWMSTEDFKSVLPRSMFQHSKYSFILDLHAKMTEVVTSGHTPRSAGQKTTGREPQYELESILRGIKAGREKGMELPPHRRENAHDFAEEIEKLTGGTGAMSSAEIMDYLKEQELAGKSTVGLNLVASIESYHIDEALKKTPNMFKTERNFGTGPRTVNTKEGKSAHTLRATVQRGRVMKQKVEALAILGEEIYNLECKILGMKDGAEKEAALQQLQNLEDDMAYGMGNISSNYRTAVPMEIDDRLALRSPVPLLQWDERPYEPLVVQPEEVWPFQRVSLVDMEPRSLPPEQTIDWMNWLQDFSFGLYDHASISVVQALDMMHHGASELIDKAPSLKDPAKGGRLNMNNLRVRMLTREMVDELCRAFHDWPFRSEDASRPNYFRMRGARAL